MPRLWSMIADAFRPSAAATTQPKVTEETPRGGAVAPPRRLQATTSWDLEQIRAARDDQERGRFQRPVRLAEAFRTDDAMFVPYCARVSTLSAVKLCWEPGSSVREVAATARAARYIKAPSHVRQAIQGTLVNHGIAIGYVLQTPSADGQNITFTLSEWPLEHVWYDSARAKLRTRTYDGADLDITHGDGRWVVFAKFGVTPWTQDACVLPGAFVWAAHALGLSSWAGAADSHGRPKVVGTLPELVKLGKEGELSPEAEALLNTLGRMMAGETDVGALPFGSKAEVLINESNAWQVFDKLTSNRERAAARLYLGTDAILGATGGAPGVDIESLFEVASTVLQNDREAIERGLREGMVEPWALLHGENPELIECWRYDLPDPDKAKRAEQEATAIERLGAALKILRDSQMQVDQTTVDALAEALGVTVPTILAAQETRVVPLDLAPTDVAKVVTVNEARLSRSLPPREGGDVTIAEQDAALARAAAPAPADPNAPGAEPSNDGTPSP